MSHITCHECGGTEHVQGYGSAAGIFGGYTICADCDFTVLELFPSRSEMPEDVQRQIDEGLADFVKQTNEKRAVKGLPLLSEKGHLDEDLHSVSSKT